MGLGRTQTSNDVPTLGAAPIVPVSHATISQSLLLATNAFSSPCGKSGGVRPARTGTVDAFRVACAIGNDLVIAPPETAFIFTSSDGNEPHGWEFCVPLVAYAPSASGSKY